MILYAAALHYSEALIFAGITFLKDHQIVKKMQIWGQVQKRPAVSLGGILTW